VYAPVLERVTLLTLNEERIDAVLPVKETHARHNCPYSTPLKFWNVGGALVLPLLSVSAITIPAIF
jgi:hypothetical protein